MDLDFSRNVKSTSNSYYHDIFYQLFIFDFVNDIYKPKLHTNKLLIKNKQLIKIMF